MSVNSVNNLPQSSTNDATTSFFENYYNQSATVSQNTNDAIIGYFTQVTGDATSGTILAASVIKSANAQGMNPMLLLDQFRQLPPGELGPYLTVLMNMNRVGTSLLGINLNPSSNKYAARCILA